MLRKHGYFFDGRGWLEFQTTDFRTHPKFAKRLYFAFKPLWWTLHAWDWLVADRFAPQWSFGFTALTQYPGSNGTDNPVDGNIRNTGTDWATVRGASAGNETLYDQQYGELAATHFVSGTTYYIWRGYFLFDTDEITAGGTVSADPTISFAKTGDAAEDTDGSDIDIVSCSPASATALADGDFDQVGATVFASKALSSWEGVAGTYQVFTLDANGVANFNKTGNSPFGARSSRDTDNSAPTGANRGYCYFSNYAGTTRDPKLQATYTIATAGAVGSLMMMGCGI